MPEYKMVTVPFMERLGVQSSLGSSAKVEWGSTPGDYGMTFASTFTGPRDPGPCTTELSVRRVIHPRIAGPELQITMEITQRYSSGANSRRMHGNICLHGEALAEFTRRVLMNPKTPLFDPVNDARSALERYDEGSRISSSKDLAESLRALLKVIDSKT